MTAEPGPNSVSLHRALATPPTTATSWPKFLVFAGLTSACGAALGQVLRFPTIPLTEGAPYPHLLDVQDPLYPWGSLAGLVWFLVLYWRGGARAVMLASCSMLAVALGVRGLWPSPAAFPLLCWAQQTSTWALGVALLIETCVHSPANDWRQRLARFVAFYLVTDLSTKVAGSLASLSPVMTPVLGLGTHEIARLMCGLLFLPTIFAARWSVKLWPQSTPQRPARDPWRPPWRPPWQLWLGAELANWLIFGVYSLLRAELYLTLEPFDLSGVTLALPFAGVAGPWLIWLVARRLKLPTVEAVWAIAVVLCSAVALATYSFEASVKAGAPLALLFSGALFCAIVGHTLLPNSPRLLAGYFVVRWVLTDCADELLAAGFLDIQVEFWARILLAVSVALLCLRWRSR